MNTGERRALWHYRLRGYRILGTNVQAGRNELDLIVRRGKELTLTSCEPSNPGTVSEAALSQALFHVLLRNSFATGVLSGSDARTATCIADGIMGLDSLTKAIATVQTPDDDLPADFDTTIAAEVKANAPRLRAQCQKTT